jgi:hypothetical protein
MTGHQRPDIGAARIQRIGETSASPRSGRRHPIRPDHRGSARIHAPAAPCSIDHHQQHTSQSKEFRHSYPTPDPEPCSDLGGSKIDTASNLLRRVLRVTRNLGIARELRGRRSNHGRMGKKRKDTPCSRGTRVDPFSRVSVSWDCGGPSMAGSGQEAGVPFPHRDRGPFNLGIDSHRVADVAQTPPDGLSSGVLPTAIDRTRLLDVRLG